MTTIKNLINEMKALKGADVQIFGQPVTLSSEVEDCNIDIIDVLKSLKEFEVDDITDYFYNDEIEEEEEKSIFSDNDNTDIIDSLLYHGLIFSEEYDKGDNSYNWMSPVNHDFNFYTFKATDGGIYVLFKVHMYGDVRGNYTDDVLLYFDNEYLFYETLSENNKYIAVEIDGDIYDIYINIFSDSFEIYTYNGEYLFTVYGCDMEEITKEIKKELKEN